MNQNIQYIVENFLFEGKIDGLDNINIIRHYTTGESLRNILATGVLMPNISPGDNDWDKKFIIKSNNVISFHIDNTDSEWDHMIVSNNQERDLIGTNTLGLHRDKICACIEIDYNKIESSIKQDASILQNYKWAARKFVNLYNGSIYIHNYFINIAKDLIEEIKQDYGKYEDEIKLYKELDYFKDTYIKNLPNMYNLFCKIAEKYIQMDFDYYKEFAGELFFTSNFITYNIEVNNYWKQYSNKVFYTEFSKEDAEKLAEMAYNFKLGKLSRFLYKKGINVFNWKSENDIQRSLQLPFTAFDFIYNGYIIYTYKKSVWADLQLITELMSFIYARKNYGKNISYLGIEVRIGSPIKITKDNAVIKIFTGICKGTNQKNIIKLAEKYKDLYTFELINPDI